MDERIGVSSERLATRSKRSVMDVLSVSATDAEYIHYNITVSARHSAVGPRHVAVILTAPTADISDDGLHSSLFTTITTLVGINNRAANNDQCGAENSKKS